jgi:hypothetical protein
VNEDPKPTTLQKSGTGHSLSVDKKEIDLEALADAVYRLLKQEVRLER